MKVRKPLSKFYGKNIHCKGTVQRFGTTKGFARKRTMLVSNVELAATNEFLADHMWLKGRGINSLQAYCGDVLEFDADVSIYCRQTEAGKPLSLDYQLRFPTNIRQIKV